MTLPHELRSHQLRPRGAGAQMSRAPLHEFPITRDSLVQVLASTDADAAGARA